MKNLIKILITIILTASAAGDLYAQVLLKNAKENNATIQNNGTIIIRTTGEVVGLPDTIGGKVEFISDRVGMSQIVPNVTYNKLTISGRTRKFVDSMLNVPAVLFNPLRTLDSFVVDSSTYVITNHVEIQAKAKVINNTHISGEKDVRLNGDTSSQTIEGKGKFSLLNIDNNDGVDVVNNGGFAVTRRLTLTRGELRNNQANNFYMSDSSLIVRYVGGILSYAPVFDKRVSVKYLGDGAIIAGPEIPVDSTVLKDMYVYNSNGLYLSNDVYVNDTLSLSTNINTEVTVQKHILTLTSDINPEFVSINAEIDGRFRRTSIGRYGDTLRFNNYYTYALFTEPNSLDSVSEMTFRVKPQELPPFLKPGEIKVYRFIQIAARDRNMKAINQGLNMTLGFGWRHSPDTLRDETKTLHPKFDKLILQRWTGSEWFDIKSSIPNIDNSNGWAYSSAFNFTDQISATGDFAIGLPGGSKLQLAARVFLEGPYRCGSMTTDLRDQGMISTTPPNIYPYSLDPYRQFIHVTQVPDSVVDWLLLEFRKTATSEERIYKTAFLRFDGRIVDLDGVSPLAFNPFDIKTGDYYVVVRHRNHLAIITDKTVAMYPESLVDYTLDLTKPSEVVGGTNSIKEIGYDMYGSKLYGMLAGFDYNNNYMIDDEDLDAFLLSRGKRGYEYYDIDMNGIVNTKDLNLPWNNRGEKSGVFK